MNKAVLFISVVFMFFAAQPGESQTTGTISGFVQDETRAVLPGVDIQAVQEGTGLTRSAISSETGTYSIPLLPPGKYTMTFALPGFQTVTSKDAIVNATERVTLNVTLHVATAGTNVEVTAVSELVQADTTTLGRVVDERLTVALPLPTKNYTQLLALSPGATAPVSDTATLGRGSINISSSGGRLVANSFMLDGVDANNIHQNMAKENTVGSNGAPVPSTEVIQEFKVQTSQYDAQSGRNAGSSVNVVTRSGTNQLRGTLFYYLRNDALNANDFFFNKNGRPRPILRQNQWGATLGGPIKHDKTFFFLGYQGTRELNGAAAGDSQRSLVLPPIPDVRTPQTLGAIFGDQTGRNGGVAVARDGSNINPVALALLNYKLPNGNYLIPSPQRPGVGVNYSISVPARFKEEQITLNLDHDFSAKHRLSLRAFGSNDPQTKPFAQANNPPGFPINQDFKNRNVVVTEVATISPKLVNEGRLGWNTPFGAITLPNRPYLQDIGMDRVNEVSVPQIPSIAVSGAFTLGYGGSSPQTIDPTTWTIQDTLSLTKGSHTMRIGGEYRKHQTNVWTAAFRGSVNFQNFADFLLGLPGGPNGTGVQFGNINSVDLISGVADTDWRAFDLGLFYQDDWKVSPQLTLNLGLRYDYMTFMWDKRGHTGNFDPRKYVNPPEGGQTSSGFVLPVNAPNAFDLPVVPKTLVDRTPNKNFGPRIGLAWRPIAGRPLVLRSGYGIFYERISNQWILQAASTPNFRTNFRASGVDAAYASFQHPFPAIPPIEAHPRLPIVYGPPFTLDRPLLSATPIDPEAETPYMQQYSLNLQYEVMRDLLLEVGYVGSKATKLPLTHRINQAILASPEHPVNGLTTNTAANAAERVPYLGFSPSGLTMNRTNSDSRYNSLQTSLTKRFSSGLQFLMSYTWSKSLDNNSGASGSTTSSVEGDQTKLWQHRGLSDFDRTHRVVFSYIYQMPAWGFSLNKTEIGRKFFSGWQLSGVALKQSGAPFSITDGNGALFYGVPSLANWAPGATVRTATLSGRTKDRLTRYFDISAFAKAGNFFGDTGRNILRGPGQANVDLAVAKTTRARETIDVEWRAEVFNLLNTTNFANPSPALESSSFGQITGTSSNARIIQFGLRLIY